MPADVPIPLCTSTQFNSGAFKNLASQYDPATLDQIMIEATRAAETAVDRRLAPFTTTETVILTSLYADEYGTSGSIPMDLRGSVGRSYADAMGAGDLVRHIWLREFAPRYQEMWTYNLSNILLIRSYGGSQQVAITSLVGPQIDSGHVWLQLGTFCPVGTEALLGYSGGYTTVPADLVRATKYLAASIIVRELDPAEQRHDPTQLHDDAMKLLANWVR